MRGPTPKPTADRQRRNAPQFTWVILPANGRTDPVPPMPAWRKWSNAAVEEWDRLWHTPSASQWRDDDPAIERLLVLFENLIRNTISAGEITAMRQIEDSLGLSPKSRLQLRWIIEGERGNEGTVHPLKVVDDPEREALRKRLG